MSGQAEMVLVELENPVLATDESAEWERLLFQTVVDALPLSLHAIDRDFKLVVWNQGREAGVFGRSRGEVLARDLFSVIGEDPALRAEYEEVFSSGVGTVSEVVGRGGDPPRIYRVEKVPMRLVSGQGVSHVITIGQDVTEQRLIERSMAQTEKMAAIGQLVTGIAHEINNPLATIAGCAEAMRSRLSTPLSDQDRCEVHEDTQLIEDEAYRCKGILQNLLDFSRSEPEGRNYCDAASVVRRTVRLVGHNKRVADVALEVEIEEDLPPVAACEEHLVQVLLTLLVNAADAAPSGCIRVRAGHRPPGEVVVSVEDDGPGIPLEVQDRVFEPFFTTKPPGKGTGLGLSVAYGLIQAHKGRLEMYSHPGTGTRFDMILPSVSEVMAENTR